MSSAAERAERETRAGDLPTIIHLPDDRQRKKYFDRVQEIALEQSPFIYLVNRNALSAISPGVHGTSPVILVPQTYWNAERLSVK